MTNRHHRAVKAVTLAMTVTISSATAQTTDPEQVARQYTQAMQAGDWMGMAALMHPAALRELRDLFDPIFAMPGAERTVPMLLGVSTMDEARTLSDTGLFAGFIQFMVNQDPNVASALSTAKVDVIGHVPEGNDAHVVFRTTLEVQGITMTQMDVITMRPSGSEWRGLLAGDLAAVAQAIRTQLSQPPNPDREDD
jgi:hypothetical protein